MAGARDLIRWLGNYFNFSFYALIRTLLSPWFPRFLCHISPWLEPRHPALWLQLLTIRYAISIGKPRSPNQTSTVNPEAVIPIRNS
jgi:lycopene cyclase CruA